MKKTTLIATFMVVFSIALATWLLLKTQPLRKTEIEKNSGNLAVANNELGEEFNTNVSSQIKSKADISLQPQSATALEVVIEGNTSETPSSRTKYIEEKLTHLDQTLNELDQKLAEKGIHQSNDESSTRKSEGHFQESTRLEKISNHIKKQ